MSASSAPSNSTSTTAVTSISTALAFLTSLPAAIIFGVVAIGLWFGVFVRTSNTIGNGVSWSSINGQVTKVVSSSMISMFVLLITSLIYFLQDQTKSIYAIFILVALGAVLSYSAMAASTAN